MIYLLIYVALLLRALRSINGNGCIEYTLMLVNSTHFPGTNPDVSGCALYTCMLVNKSSETILGKSVIEHEYDSIGCLYTRKQFINLQERSLNF